MYVKIRRDGAIGIGRGTEGIREIAIGYGEAHMIAAALEKLAQTARSFKQTYKKTTDVGAGNKIDFARTDTGSIILSGDGLTFYCTEEEIRELADKLKHLPPIEVAPASDYVQKTTPQGGYCVKVTNSGNSMKLTLPEAAVMRTSVQASIDSRFYHEQVAIGARTIAVDRSSDLKWQLSADNESVKFTAYEVEALLAGLHNAVLDVLMDTIKAKGSDDLADIRVKSQIQRIEQESTKLLKDHKNGKAIVKELLKKAKKILGTGADADQRTHEFIGMCNYVHAKLEPELLQPLFGLFTKTFVFES